MLKFEKAVEKRHILSDALNSGENEEFEKLNINHISKEECINKYFKPNE